MPHDHPYLNNLTPLRGIAALWVASYHFQISFFHPHMTRLLEKGYVMVDMFFIMSGFIMRHVYGDYFREQIGGKSMEKFMVARFARVYPLHLFTLIVLVAITAYTGEWSIVNDPSAISTNIFLLQSFGIEKLSTWNRASWSISAEWAAYIAFPFLSILIGHRRRLAYFLLPSLIIMAYIALLYLLAPKGIGNARRLELHMLDVSYDYGFLRGIAGFCLGMLVYELYAIPRIREYFGTDIIAVVFIAATLYYMYIDSNDLLLILTFVGVILSFAANSGHLHRLCSLKLPQFLGKVSYSVYLIQGLVLYLVTQLLGWFGSKEVAFSPNIFILFAYLSLLVGLSSITYYGVENPCRNFINRNFR